MQTKVKLSRIIITKTKQFKRFKIVSEPTRTSAIRSEKEALQRIRGVIRSLSVDANQLQVNITNVRRVELRDARRQLVNLRRENASPKDITAAWQNVRSLQAELISLRSMRRNYNQLKWCLRRCIMTFLRNFSFSGFQQCESTCYLNNPVDSSSVNLFSFLGWLSVLNKPFYVFAH